MRVRATANYKDTQKKRMVRAGEVFEVSAERAEMLFKANVAVEIKAEPEQPEEKAEDAAEPEQPEEKAEDVAEPEQPEEKAEDAAEPEQPEEKAEDAAEPEQPKKTTKRKKTDKEA